MADMQEILKRRLTTEAQIPGKTIKEATINPGDIALAFTDGTFFVAGIMGYGSEDCDHEIESENYPITSHDLLNLGLVTQEEFHELREAEKAAELATKRDARRQQYEELRKEFEPPGV
jgi:hypothetical protein